MKHQCSPISTKISIGIGNKCLLLIEGNPEWPNKVQLFTQEFADRVTFGEGKGLEDIENRLGDFFLPKEAEYTNQEMGELLNSEFAAYQSRLLEMK